MFYTGGSQQDVNETISERESHFASLGLELSDNNTSTEASESNKETNNVGSILSSPPANANLLHNVKESEEKEKLASSNVATLAGDGNNDVKKGKENLSSAVAAHSAEEHSNYDVSSTSTEEDEEHKKKRKHKKAKKLSKKKKKHKKHQKLKRNWGESRPDDHLVIHVQGD